MYIILSWCVVHSQRLMSRLAKLRQLDGETIREDEVKDEALVVNNEPVPLGTSHR